MACGGGVNEVLKPSFGYVPAEWELLQNVPYDADRTHPYEWGRLSYEKLYEADGRPVLIAGVTIAYADASIYIPQEFQGRELDEETLIELADEEEGNQGTGPDYEGTMIIDGELAGYVEDCVPPFEGLNFEHCYKYIVFVKESTYIIIWVFYGKNNTQDIMDIESMLNSITFD